MWRRRLRNKIKKLRKVNWNHQRIRKLVMQGIGKHQKENTVLE